MKILKHRGETVTLATSVGFPQVRGIPPQMNKLEVEVPSATKENILLAFTPKIKKVWFLTGTTYTDLTSAVTDRNTGTGTGSSLNSMGTADIVYAGCPTQFRGVAVDIGSANSNAATIDAEYWNGTAWTDLTETDGTASGGAIFAQDGLITWTMPTNWAKTTVNSEATELFWMRIKVSATLSATVSILELTALANTTLNTSTGDSEGNDYVIIQSNAQSLPPYSFYFNHELWGGVELKSTSITSAANLNWYQCAGGY